MTATFGRASNRVCIYTDAPKQRQFCSLLNRVVKMGGHGIPATVADRPMRIGAAPETPLVLTSMPHHSCPLSQAA